MKGTSNQETTGSELSKYYVINIREENIDDLSDLYELMMTFPPEYCMKIYGFTAEMVAAEVRAREDSL